MKTFWRFQIVLIALTAFAISVAMAQAQKSPTKTSMPAGAVQPSVKLLADASNSYALYLPSNYSPQKRWPLLLAFDPGGVGVDPVKLFQPAAEKYGFILVGSNNSRNFVDPSTTIRLLWQDVKSRYAIDPRRIYLTGFSGGSRVAAAVAISCKNCIAGVISCGAGLPTGANLPPAETTDWFFTAGTLDFNYAEIIRLADALDANHAATHLAFFDGPHHWMPPAVAEEALAWMQLRAMIKGIAPMDKNFVESEFNQQVAIATALQKSGNVLAAFRDYRQIIHDFAGLRDIKEIQAEQAQLAESSELKRARKNEQAALDLQDKTSSSIVTLTNAIINKEKAPGILYQELEALMIQIQHDRETEQESVRRDALTRGIAGAFAYARESGSEDLLKKDDSQARDLFKAAAIIRPDAPWPHYLVALAAARMGEIKQALEELGKSAEHGLNNPELLQDHDFDKLRENSAFKEITARVAKNAAAQHEN